jgi:hypothetical protein
MTQWIMTQQTGQTEAVMHAAVLGVILRLTPTVPDLPLPSFGYCDNT